MWMENKGWGWEVGCDDVEEIGKDQTTYGPTGCDKAFGFYSKISGEVLTGFRQTHLV